MKKLIINLITIALIFFGTAFSAFSQLNVHHLQCEYRSNPLGLDELNPRLSWYLSSLNSKKQESYQIVVAGSEEKLNAGVGDLWDTGKVKSGQSNNIKYSGKNLKSFQKCWWKVMVWDEEGRKSEWSNNAFFTIGPLTKLDWSAEWIGADKEATKQNFPFIRKTFELDNIPKNAIAHINVMGYFEIYVNGHEVSKDILNPSVSDYSKQTLYVSQDIQPYLKKGKNEIRIWLAHGWYRQTPVEYFGVAGERPLLRALIQLDFNIKNKFIATDRTWEFSESNREYTGGWQWGNFGGEKILSEDEMKISNNGLDNKKSWRQVENYKVHDIPAIAQRNNPTQIIDTINLISVEQIQEKEYLIDFGRHLTGWIRIKFSGISADSIIMIEYIDKIVDPDKITDPIEKSFTRLLKNDKKRRGIITYNQKDIIYTSKKESEFFQNKFNYHAFRWIKISGLHRQDIQKLLALQISETNEQVSAFYSSNPLLNKIWQAVINTYRCINYSGYVVDCPHRERVGYGGDSHSSMEAALSSFDMAALYNKWTLDWNAGNYPNGLWSHSAPEHPGHKNKFSPGWGGFGMFMPWQFYIYYGDTINLSRAYPFIRRWMEYLKSNVHEGILTKDSIRGNTEGWSFHGDWVAPYYGMQPENRVDQNSTNLFNNCFYLYELKLASKIATVLSKTSDAEYYLSLYDKFKPIIHEKFYNPDKKYYANGEQPYQAFPLLVGLINGSEKAELEEYLEYLITDKNEGHLNSGMLGTYFLLEYLMKTGRNDLIYTMVNQSSFPGWGYMIENGATTIWEQWNGSNSQIHNCYLSVGKWFIQGLGGIQPDSNKGGFSNFIINPGFVEGLDFVNTSYNTRYGRIISNWKRNSGSIIHEVLVPVNTSAVYNAPFAEYDKIMIDGKNVNKRDVIRLNPGRHEVKMIR